MTKQEKKNTLSTSDFDKKVMEMFGADRDKVEEFREKVNNLLLKKSLEKTRSLTRSSAIKKYDDLLMEEELFIVPDLNSDYAEASFSLLDFGIVPTVLYDIRSKELVDNT